MKCDEVKDSISPLAYYSNITIEIITREPRHASPRSYIDIITTTLQGIKPKYKQLEVSREPTYRIEEWEKISKEIMETIVVLRTRRVYIGPVREQKEGITWREKQATSLIY
jgi:predicted mannosyl-3-phosphoglycerate phosphatase (HAD superfamily)